MKCPLPRYWMCHAIVAVLIALALWPMFGLKFGLGIGAGVYIGREFTQWEQGGGAGLPFDWRGAVWPVAVCIAALVIAAAYGLVGV